MKVLQVLLVVVAFSVCNSEDGFLDDFFTRFPSLPFSHIHPAGPDNDAYFKTTFFMHKNELEGGDRHYRYPKHIRVESVQVPVNPPKKFQDEIVTPHTRSYPFQSYLKPDGVIPEGRENLDIFEGLRFDTPPEQSYPKASREEVGIDNFKSNFESKKLNFNQPQKILELEEVIPYHIEKPKTHETLQVSSMLDRVKGGKTFSSFQDVNFKHLKPFKAVPDDDVIEPLLSSQEKTKHEKRQSDLTGENKLKQFTSIESHTQDVEIETPSSYQYVSFGKANSHIPSVTHLPVKSSRPERTPAINEVETLAPNHQLESFHDEDPLPHVKIHTTSTRPPIFPQASLGGKHEFEKFLGDEFAGANQFKKVPLQDTNSQSFKLDGKFSKRKPDLNSFDEQISPNRDAGPFQVVDAVKFPKPFFPIDAHERPSHDEVPFYFKSQEFHRYQGIRQNDKINQDFSKPDPFEIVSAGKFRGPKLMAVNSGYAKIEDESTNFHDEETFEYDDVEDFRHIRQTSNFNDDFRAVIEKQVEMSRDPKAPVMSDFEHADSPGKNKFEGHLVVVDPLQGFRSPPPRPPVRDEHLEEIIVGTPLHDSVRMVSSQPSLSNGPPLGGKKPTSTVKPFGSFMKLKHPKKFPGFEENFDHEKEVHPVHFEVEDAMEQFGFARPRPQAVDHLNQEPELTTSKTKFPAEVGNLPIDDFPDFFKLRPAMEANTDFLTEFESSRQKMNHEHAKREQTEQKTVSHVTEDSRQPLTSHPRPPTEVQLQRPIEVVTIPTVQKGLPNPVDMLFDQWNSMIRPLESGLKPLENGIKAHTKLMGNTLFRSKPSKFRHRSSGKRRRRPHPRRKKVASDVIVFEAQPSSDAPVFLEDELSDEHGESGKSSEKREMSVEARDESTREPRMAEEDYDRLGDFSEDNLRKSVTDRLEKLFSQRKVNSKLFKK